MQNYMAIQFKIMAKVGRTVVFFEIIGAKSMTVSFAESSGEAISKYRVMGRFSTPYISTNQWWQEEWWLSNLIYTFIWSNFKETLKLLLVQKNFSCQFA